MEPAHAIGAVPSGGWSVQTRAWARALRLAGLTAADVGAVVGRTGEAVKSWRQGRSRPSEAVREVLSTWLSSRGIDPSLLFDPRSAVSDIHDLDAEREARGLPPAHHHQEEPVQITSREYLDPEELEFFGLQDDPFQEPEDPEDIWLSDALAHIEQAIWRAVQHRQILALVAPSGAGKSTLLRRFYGRAGTMKQLRLVAPATLDRRRVTHAALATAIVRDLTGRETSSMSMEQRDLLLRSTLEDQDSAGIRVALLIDEAHLLNGQALLGLKHLWDSHTLFRQLAVLLVGQPVLESRLRTDPTLRELTGRTRILAVPALRPEDVASYLRWRLSRVGGTADDIFDESAVKALSAMGEAPLWINNKAALAMRYARTLGDRRISAAHVGRA